MKPSIPYETARSLLLQHVSPVATEEIPLACSFGRILAEDLLAKSDVPSFDRSPYDGYALCSRDTAGATEKQPVTLTILEEIPAGGVSHVPLTPGTAVKILTGAPIPEGADAVIPFEKTVFTETTVTVFAPVKSGSNIVYRGEDVKKGCLLAPKGTYIDPGLMGTLAAQNITAPKVYKTPVVGILSTGSELLEPGTPAEPGKIYNSNAYMLLCALQQLGIKPLLLGIAADNASAIAQKLEFGLTQCDAVLITGGVSVGDYDLTPTAMEQIGATILFHGAAIKPGMACAYGTKDGKLLCGLSGNPASAITNFYTVALPALRQLCGHSHVLPETIPVLIKDGFEKASKVTRFLRGRADFGTGQVSMTVPVEQGNAVLRSTIGCDILVEIPAGSGPVEAGTVLHGFLL